jgi:hypothetical protein
VEKQFAVRPPRAVGEPGEVSRAASGYKGTELASGTLHLGMNCRHVRLGRQVTDRLRPQGRCQGRRRVRAAHQSGCRSLLSGGAHAGSGIQFNRDGANARESLAALGAVAAARASRRTLMMCTSASLVSSSKHRQRGERSVVGVALRPAARPSVVRTDLPSCGRSLLGAYSGQSSQRTSEVQWRALVDSADPVRRNLRMLRWQ